MKNYFRSALVYLTEEIVEIENPPENIKEGDIYVSFDDEEGKHNFFMNPENFDEITELENLKDINFSTFTFMEAVFLASYGYKMRSKEWAKGSFIGRKADGNIVHVHPRGESTLAMSDHYFRMKEWEVVL